MTEDRSQKYKLRMPSPSFGKARTERHQKTWAQPSNKTQNMKNIIILVAIAIAITGCKPKQTATVTSSSTEQKTDTQPVVILQNITISEMVDMKNSGDPYTIENAKISGDTLILQMSYGGGCEEHNFELLNNNAYEENVDEWGDVVYATRFTLKHNANNDRCRSIVQSEEYFDLTNVKQLGSTRIHIKLSGWENQLLYQYTLSKHSN